MAKKKIRTPEKSDTPRQDAFEAAWEKFKPLVPEDELSAIEASFSRPLERAFRINPQKITAQDVETIACRYGWQTDPVVFCPEGYKIRAGEISPGQTVEHRTGQYYIQDSASMLPGVLFSSEIMAQRPLILDMAASPGGKTTHLCARSGDKGLILANDSSPSRIGALKNVLKKWGVLSHLVTAFPGENFGNWYPETFDLILLDAPCSMQSLVSIESHPLRPITEREEEALAQRQTALLDSALKALKPGGQVVYSTCTLSVQEDEAVVNQMIKRYGNLIQVENANKLIPHPAPGVTRAGDQIFDDSLAGTLRFWPHRYDTAGFYAALIWKKEAFGTSNTELPNRAWEKSGFSELGRSSRQDILDWFADQFHCELETCLTESEAVLWQRGNEVWALPERYLSTFSDIPCKSAGMRLATAASGGGWIPDDDWVARFFPVFTNQLFRLDDGQTAAWLRGEDLRLESGYPKGSILLMIDDFGVFLGCGRVGGEKIRNFNK